MRSALLPLALCLLCTPALAAEPEFAWEDDGTLVATVVFPVPIATVQKLFADPVRAISLSPDVKNVTAKAVGSCHEVTVTTTGISDPFVYRSKRCPTAHGVKDELIESEDYKEQSSEWVLSSVDGGTRAVFRTRTKLTAWVPDSFVKSGVKKGVGKTIDAMEKALRTP